MTILIIKLGAAGDVVRTTALLHLFPDCNITWITDAKNLPLIQMPGIRALSWDERHLATHYYDLVINLEDGLIVGHFLTELHYSDLFGAYLGDKGMAYTDSSKEWFDMSLISRYGFAEANRRKLVNRCSYQDILYRGLWGRFTDQPYLLPPGIRTDLSGDVAVAPKAGSCWSRKNWPHYPELIDQLRHMGFEVNILPVRSSLLEHIWDIKEHRCLISGDSLPMHLSLGFGLPTVTIFTCTSPWEIFDYGVQTKLISPDLDKFFYDRSDPDPSYSPLPVEQVIDAVAHKIRWGIGTMNNPLPAHPSQGYSYSCPSH